jgi:multiple sugar transport system substrate-binding protein
MGMAASWEWYTYLFDFGGEVLRDGDYQVIVDQPPAVASMQWIVDNYRKYRIYPNGVTTFDYTEFATLFQQGKVAMCENWPYMYTLAKDPKQSTVAGKFAIGPRPRKATNGAPNGGWSYNVLKTAHNPDAAIAAAAYLTSAASVRNWSLGTNNVPTRKSVMTELLAHDHAYWSVIEDNLAHNKVLNILTAGPSRPGIETAIEEAIQSSLIGRSTAQAALTQAKSTITKLLKQNRFYEQLHANS